MTIIGLLPSKLSSKVCLEKCEQLLILELVLKDNEQASVDPKNSSGGWLCFYLFLILRSGGS